MRVKRGSKIYKNVVDGKIVEETDFDFQNRSKKFGFNFLVSRLFDKLKFYEVSDKLDRENVIYIKREDGSKIYFSYFKVTNAGQDTDRKRMQIPENYFGLNLNNDRPENDTYFFIGLYPTGDNCDPVYVILDNDGISLNPHESYSSLWINFNTLYSAYNNGIHYAINTRNGNKFVAFKESHWPLLIKAILENDFTGIINNNLTYIDKSGNEITEEESRCVEFYNERRDAFVQNQKPKLKKNSNYRDLILYESDYQCSLCGKKTTFITNANIMYFEAHHLIPCNFAMQQNFEKKLDTPVNMYCLCPECHRKIHFINDKQVDDLLIKLYNERKNSYVNNYKLKLEDLIGIYKKIDRKNEEEM